MKCDNKNTTLSYLIMYLKYKEKWHIVITVSIWPLIKCTQCGSWCVNSQYCRVIGWPFCVATSVCINLSQNELFSWRAFEAAEHLSAEKPSCVSLRCRKLIRFKKVMVEVLRFVSAFFFSFFFCYHLKKKKGQHQNSTWTLFSHPESWFKREKKKYHSTLFA